MTAPARNSRRKAETGTVVLGIILGTIGVICLLLSLAESSDGTYIEPDFYIAGALLLLSGAGLIAWGWRKIPKRRPDNGQDVEARDRRS